MQSIARAYSLGGMEKKCPICGKTFLQQPEWAYKLYKAKGGVAVYYCSWTCFRKAQAEKKQKMKYAKREDL